MSKLSERKFAVAEGLLNHIEDYLRVNGGKRRTSLIHDIVKYSERIYELAREHEREDYRGHRDNMDKMDGG